MFSIWKYILTATKWFMSRSTTKPTKWHAPSEDSDQPGHPRSRIYPPELQLNKANTSDTEAPFLDLHLSISNRFVSSKIYDKRDDFDVDIVNFPVLDGDVPRSISYGVNISQLIRFARASSHVADFNARIKNLTAKLLQQGYRSHNHRNIVPKFYHRHMNWFLNSMLDYKHFCVKAYRNRKIMVTKCINKKKKKKKNR